MNMISTEFLNPLGGRIALRNLRHSSFNSRVVHSQRWPLHFFHYVFAARYLCLHCPSGGRRMPHQEAQRRLLEYIRGLELRRQTPRCALLSLPS